jgi:peroxiredoxin
MANLRLVFLAAAVVLVGLPALRADAGMVGQAAPAWRLKDVRGQPVSSDDFKGKVVVLNFWATWCPPCRREIPGFVDLAKKFQGQVAFVGVSMDEGGPDGVRKFVERYSVSYPIVMGNYQVAGAYRMGDAIPVTYLIDQEGTIRDEHVGQEDPAALEKRIAALLAPPS